MFNLGFTEIILLGILALIFIGPKQLPEIARTVGRVLNELKRAQSDLTNVITSETRQTFTPTPDPIAKTEAEIQSAATEVKDSDEENKRTT